MDNFNRLFFIKIKEKWTKEQKKSIFFVKPKVKFDYKVGILIKNISALKYFQVFIELFSLFKLYIEFGKYLKAFFLLLFIKISLNIICGYKGINEYLV